MYLKRNEVEAVKKNLLRAAITKNELSISKLSDEVGICESALRRKINGEVQFSIAEADRVSEALKLDDSEILVIFFDRDVSYKKQIIS